MKKITCLLLLGAVVLTACNTLSITNETDVATEITDVTTEITSAATTTAITHASEITVENAPAEEDFNGNIITLNENGTIEINEGGTHIVSGATANGRIVFNTSEDILIVLNGVDIISPLLPAIEFIGTGNATIEIADNTTNNLTDIKVKKKERVNENAVIHSNSSVVITGAGTLNITGESRSTVYAENDIIVQNGTLNLDSDYEGIACDGELIINGGRLNITAKDDALNAENNLVINDGYIYAVTKGDGIDSNGDLTINGGELYVFAALKKNGGLDISDGDVYGNFYMNGGIVVATGGNNPIPVDGSSTQGYSWIEPPRELDKKEVVTVQVIAGNGDEVVSFTAPKGFELLFVSLPQLERGGHALELVLDRG